MDSEQGERQGGLPASPFYDFFLLSFMSLFLSNTKTILPVQYDYPPLVNQIGEKDKFIQFGLVLK